MLAPEIFSRKTSNCPSYLGIPACPMLLVQRRNTLRPPELIAVGEKRVKMLPVPKVLLLVSDAGEQAVLQQTLAPHVELTWVSSPPELFRQLEQSSFDVVFCSRTLSMGNWREVLEEVRQFNPNLPVIILSPTAREDEWEEVLAAGAFDLLGPASYEREPLFVVEHAVASYEARLRQSNALSLVAKAS